MVYGGGMGAISIGSMDGGKLQESEPAVFDFLMKYFCMMYSVQIVGQVFASLIEVGVPLLLTDLPFCFLASTHAIEAIFVVLLSVDVIVALNLEGPSVFVSKLGNIVSVVLLALSLLALRSQTMELLEAVPDGGLHICRLILQLSRARLSYTRLTDLTKSIEAPPISPEPVMLTELRPSMDESKNRPLIECDHGALEKDGQELEVALKKRARTSLGFFSQYYVGLCLVQLVGQLVAPVSTLVIGWLHDGVPHCTHMAMNIIDFAFIVLLSVDVTVLGRHFGLSAFLRKRENQLLLGLLCLSLLALFSEALQDRKGVV